ncbi:cytochrome P450 [Aspergillus ambiguus]|uniref:cytochrome P450 n=1 Tax=Aspergillus ambiguus TaxID=176160 RepID=UPI003CCDC972
MESPAIISLALVSLYVLYKCLESISDRRKAKALGCLPVHIRRNCLPLGLDQVYRLLKADQVGQIPEFFAQVFREEGGRRTIQGSTFGSTYIQTVDPKNIQALLATQFHDFELGRLRRSVFFPLLGNGIFTADGKAWEHSRAMLRPQFTRGQISDLELEERHVQELLQQLQPGEGGWTQQTNITPMFFRLTIDSATEFLFGVSVHSQRYASSQQIGDELSFPWKNLATSFDEGTLHLGYRFLLRDFYWLYNPKSFRDNIKEVHRFADFCIRKALQRAEETKSCASTSAQKYTFLDELIKTTRDPDELKSQLLNILLAGRDTTASLLSWTFWLLAQHPNEYKKLRSLIIQDFGVDGQTGQITFSSLKSCTYLQYVMNEVLRLFPAVPLNARRAVRDTSLPVGGGPDGKSPVFVKKGQEVDYCICITHRLEEYWGGDANEFNPDRWIDRKHGWDYLPFNGGPRICLGQQFALTEAGYVIVRMLQRFDQVRLAAPPSAPSHKYGITDAPHDYMIYFHDTRG